MPSWIRKNVNPGDRVTVEVQYSDRGVLRPLVGVLRTVEVIDRRRAVIFNEDGSRYAVHGRTVPPVALVDVSIFPDRVTGGLWAQVYDLPPRMRGPYPLPARDALVAEPDGRGGVARLASCWCGAGCGCPTCGEQMVMIPARGGLEWSVQSVGGGRRSYRCHDSSPCPLPEPSDPWGGPDCCAMPMMLAPVAWVCRRESVHRRPYQWPEHPTTTA
jgi:hypothetical protein